ncbi:hypothetical protein ACWGCP_30450 [Streptomyces niveus]
MPKTVGRSGASHAMTVNEPVVAMIRPKPDLDLLTKEPAAAQAAARAVGAPGGRCPGPNSTTLRTRVLLVSTSSASVPRPAR